MQVEILKKLIQLFETWAGEAVETHELLPLSGSDRRYVRLASATKKAIGTHHIDGRENEAFVAFTKYFVAKKLPVPRLFAEQLADNIYLLEDLGDQNLLDTLEKNRTSETISPQVIELYKQSLAALADLQNVGDDFPYELCCQRQAFDKQAIIDDLHYFKYYFLKVCKLPFDELALEKDFHALADFLMLADTSFFLFRDCQARNIMIVNNKPYFIDYQGGMRGSLYYDPASLLSQAKANLPETLREHLITYYFNVLKEKNINPKDKAPADQLYEGYKLIRLIQVLGSYGFRGLFEGREHFLKSIPFGLQNVKDFFERSNLPLGLPCLKDCLLRLAALPRFQPFDRQRAAQSRLMVKVASFSYLKSGIPKDASTNGGGFVFDCRPIHNPGRYEPYKQLTGRDKPVADFLQAQSKMNFFLQNIYNIIDEAVETYIERDFTDLMISFGCTGGQHRSVYAAEQTAKHLKEKYGVKVELQHFEQNFPIERNY